MAKNAFIALALRNLRPPVTAAGSKKLISRRLLLTTLVRLPLIAGIVMSSRAFAARRQRRREAHAELTIAAVINRMLPAHELPGALALGIDRRIGAMTDLELKRSLAEGVAWLDGRARRQGVSEFLELDEARQELVLQEALASSADGASAIVWTLRRLAFTLHRSYDHGRFRLCWASPTRRLPGFPGGAKMTDAAWDVVVGSGAGGAAAACGLCQRGLSVLMLEAGPRFDPATDYGQAEADWELREFPEKPGSTGKVVMARGQVLSTDEPLLASANRAAGREVESRRRAMGQYRHVRGVGGSTLHFTGEAHRLHPDAMRMKTRFGVAADWPIDYAELEPYYVRAEELVGVAGPAAQGARWRSKPFPLPPHPLSYGAHTLGKGAAALGLRWEPNSRAALSQPYR